MNAINTCVYVVGEPGNNGLSQVYALAEAMGVQIAETLCDMPGSIASFRRLQDYIKLGLCQRVLMYDLNALGGDHWLRLENELFMRRNRVKLGFVIKPKKDARYRLANAVKLYYSPGCTWSVRHGDELPAPCTPAGKRKLPAGYVNNNGVIEINEPEAERIRGLFHDYGSGLGFAQMLERYNACGLQADTGAINNILCSRRYLGEGSESGYRLPGVISYAEWFAACERRLSNSRRACDAASGPMPFYVPGSKGCAVRYYRGYAPKDSSGYVLIDSQKLERAMAKAIARAAKDRAEAFYRGYVLDMRRLAQEAEPAASAAVGSANEKLARLVVSLSEGEREDGLRSRLQTTLDECHAASFRLRRLKTELELFGLTREQVCAFFSRAGRLGSLAREEQSFIASAFIIKARAAGQGVWLKLVSPADGTANEVLIPIEELN